MSGTKGFLHIFNVSINRPGSENDVDLLMETFQLMGAEVTFTENAEKKRIREEIRKLKLMDFSKYSYVSIAYMSHGTHDGVVETPESIMEIMKTILIPLCNMESLNGKLKWLIIQACRGSYDFIQQSTEGPSPTVKFPKYCVKFFATSEGMKAYRLHHAIFIKALCTRLRKEYMEHDIISIFNRSLDDIAGTLSAYSITQIPSVEDNLGTKKFYITSGIQ